MNSKSIIRGGISFIVLFTTIVNAFSQVALPNDSVNSKKHKTSWTKVVAAPVVLISAGLLTTTDNEFIDKYEVHKRRNEWASGFHTHVDNYLQYAPIAAVYGLNAAGIKGEHDLANQTALLVKSEILMTAMVFPLKKFTAVPRPDTGAPTSFPSGHTAQAFAAATFLHKEYGKDHPWYSVMAYGTATAVGVLRVLNNRHWVSDVLAGAGIGILATNLAYLTHQNKWGKKHKKLSGVMMTPTYGQRSLGMYVMIPVGQTTHRR
ncbi:MAG TPA: phosphatase PAP2 family protein [Cyclobacteriaceae bacterium]|jgi:membrane-associated phospholipid phosphatase|nr:phosphatase PAP2 family protein [Cyclobacteriaceae bacterium]